jgi:tetratricopeptide (TPR) repeat protein
MRRAGLALVWIASVAVAASARADTPPSVWDIAKDPAQHDRWSLHVRVQRLLQAQPETELEPGEVGRAARALRLESARAMLEQGGAADSPDVRLQFDLGVVDSELGEAEARPDLLQEAIRILVPALGKHPDHPAATEAMYHLVLCYTRLNRPADEVLAWQRYIPRLVDDGTARAVSLMNMGEAQMRLGHAEEALETFREVVSIVTAIPNSGDLYPLVEWDIAVAMDRSGDARGATDEASKLLGMGGGPAFAGGAPFPVALHNPRVFRGTLVLRKPNVFFVPPWELEWYLALAYAADGRDAQDPRAAAEAWNDAESHWRRYVQLSSASSEKDPWLPIARLRLAHAHDARVRAETRPQKH